MASASYQIARDGLWSSGPSEVTAGTAAPTTANMLEVRIDLAAGWTRHEIELAMDRIHRHVLDTINGDTAAPFAL